MVFTSYLYLLCFLPIVVLIHYFLLGIGPYKHRIVLSDFFIIVTSLIFYGTWKPIYLLLLTFSIIFNYLMGNVINDSRGGVRKVYLALAVLANISLLVYFKYTNFIIDSTNYIFHWHIVIDQIVLPLAISFFTFQQIAWLMDQYRNDAPSCNFLDYSCAVAFFPHLIAGPIVHYHDLIPQFIVDWKLRRCYISEKLFNALFLISFGVFKKIVIADTLSYYVGLYFDTNSQINFLQAVVATLAYTFQLYFDFSGYCDIALGSALLLGISLPLNFDLPYRSASIQEFWRRWHITLGQFFTRYLYFPLGGSRNGFPKTLRNIFLIMFISGIWHGAGVGFILWGTAHGVAMVTQRCYGKFKFTVLPKWLSVTITFAFVSLAWIPFRAVTWEKTCRIFDAFTTEFTQQQVSVLRSVDITSLDSVFNSLGKLLKLNYQDSVVLILMLIASFLIVFCLPRCQTIYDHYIHKKQGALSLIWACMAGVFLAVSLIKMGVQPFSEFIYFNF